MDTALQIAMYAWLALVLLFFVAWAGRPSRS